MRLSGAITFAFEMNAVFSLVIVLISASGNAQAQNYERYKPLDLRRAQTRAAELPQTKDLPERVEDDRVLVASLDAVVIVDDRTKIVTDESIDDLKGIHYRFRCTNALVHQSEIRSIVRSQLGQPITLRQINQLSRDIIKQYHECKQPIIDVLIPEQRITGGTIHIVVTESRIGCVKVKPDCNFSEDEIARWIQFTKPGKKIYEPWIEDDLLWMNQTSFRTVSVNFEKGQSPGTTDIVFSSKDRAPLRGYIGIDDSGVETLKFGRFFAGFQYGNVLGRGGTLGYQYTTDESFSLLEAHSINYIHPINRKYSFLTYGSWSSVSPMLGDGLSQDGQSHQHGSTLTRNLHRSQDRVQNLTAGYEFKATNNNLEFAGTTISRSVADLFQLRLGFDQFLRRSIDEFRRFNLDLFIGPGGGTTGHHSVDAFDSIRPGTTPDYVYTRLRYERADLIGPRWLLTSRFTGQVASERLLFSETLGLGGYDTIRGTDQRAFNADHGWIANLEFGPKTHRWGRDTDPRTLRNYVFIDMGNGYTEAPQIGEDASTFALSVGLGSRLQISDRLSGRFDYGIGLQNIAGTTRDDRAHFGLTWISGR